MATTPTTTHPHHPMNKLATEKEVWRHYCTSEIATVQPLLEKHGIILDEAQLHIVGERYLTRPLAGAKKLLLLGKRVADDMRVVVKVASDTAGITEIQHERTCREMLSSMKFAHNILHSPDELLFIHEQNRAILVSEFIEQPCSFTERPIPEQFTLALSILKVQEQAHATTHGHIKTVRKTFGEIHADDYLSKCQAYITEINASAKNKALEQTLRQSIELLRKNKKTIEQYTGFLTNWDLTPQNIRVTNERIYFLDHASFHFGNKHESWARFINFMSLYEPQVAQTLVEYVHNNRAHEEVTSLKLMRIYRLVELIRFYTEWLTRAEGNVHELALARIDFWHEVLKATINDTFISEEKRVGYIKKRDTLRSDDEKKRQIGLH